MSDISTVLGTEQDKTDTAPAGTVLEKVQALAAENFPTVSEADLLHRHSQPPPMMIERFLETSSLTMLSGPHGSGKTNLMLAAGIAAARGQAMAGHFAVRQKHRVLFLGLEASSVQYAKQHSKLLRGLGEGELSGVDFLMKPGVNVADARQATLLEAQILAGGYDLVLVDGLKALHDVDENSNTEMDRVMLWMVGLCQQGITVVFSHHTSKPGPLSDPNSKNRSRGASVIPARCDCEWRVGLKGHVLAMECVKSRGGIDHGAKVKLQMDWDDSQITLRYAADLVGLPEALYEALEKAGPVGLKKAHLVSIAKKHGSDGPTPEAVQQRVERALKSLIAAGRVKHEGQGQPYVIAKQGVKGSGL